MLTKKDYQAIANIFREPIEVCCEPLAKDLARNMADYFEQDNPRFNRAKFLEACGLDED